MSIGILLKEDEELLSYLNEFHVFGGVRPSVTELCKLSSELSTGDCAMRRDIVVSFKAFLTESKMSTIYKVKFTFK